MFQSWWVKVGGPSKDIRLFLLTRRGLSKKLRDDFKCIFLLFLSKVLALFQVV